MSDVTATPPLEVTDPGFKQNNDKIGAHDEFTLPDVVRIISPTHTSWVGRYTQEGWVRFNYLLRGLIGTGIEWYVFFAEVAKAYPQAAVIVFVTVGSTLEERFSENPVLANTMRYGMEAMDPTAADKIFAPKVYAEDPIGDASKKLLDDSTKAYLASPEYAQLKLDVEQDVQREIRRSTYAAAGMKDDVAEVDAEIAAAAAERAAKHAPPQPEPPAEPAPQAPLTPVPTP